MSPKSLRIAVLIGTALVVSQASRAQVAAGTTGSAVQNGTTVMLGNAPTTPITTYAAPPPTAGISNAGRAGISNSEPLPSTLPGQTDTVVYFSQPGVQPVAAMPATTEAGITPSPAESPAGTTAAGAPGSRTINDFVPSTAVVSAPGTTSAASLGEISAEFKARKAAGNARMLTNQDVQQMLGNKAGVTVAKNMPPLERGLPGGVAANSETSTATAQAAPSGNTIAQASSQAGQGGTPATPPGQAGTTGRQAGTPPPADTTQQQPAGTQATAGSSTTPSVNPNPQSNDARGKSRLPATATILPLLGLLGVVSSAIGLWYRRFRR